MLLGTFLGESMGIIWDSHRGTVPPNGLFFDGTSHENDGVPPILGNLHVEMALFFLFPPACELILT
jgi:hypothetical protein